MLLSLSNRKQKIIILMNNYYIDEITWNDLSMEMVYNRLNKAESSVGQEHLRTVLKSMLSEENELKKRSLRADQFSEDPSLRKKCQGVFKNLGKTKKLSLYDYIFRFNEIKEAGNAPHYLMALLLLAAIALIFVNPLIGIISLVVMFVINIASYFKAKAAIEGYFMCFKYIIRMLKAAANLKKILSEKQNSSPESAAMSEVLESLESAAKDLSALKRGAWLLTNSVSGSLIDVVMDYVRMLFHVDIIRFNSMRKLAAEKTESIDLLFKSLGEIETDICISLFRESLDIWCRPEFECDSSKEPEKHLKALQMYHPLTSTIVTNDIDVRRSVLLTGSNASGKSTFLKQAAINQIFAQTIYTCLAAVFQTRISRVLSSMALTDNILGNESYFVVEIRSLKRILDAVKEEDGAPVMCFIDEVLRGTNTKERIAASSQILKKLSASSALCFAATHDIELTSLLKDDMDNYHFEESVEGNDVAFDYKIRKGPATSRNAIKLMKAMGFDSDITEKAELMTKLLKP